MHVVSVNVGLPRRVRWKGRDVTTGIFKVPVEGRVALHRLNFQGDGQADLSVHGGAEKAVYAYPAEHYTLWREELGTELPFEMLARDRARISVREITRVYARDRDDVATIERLVALRRSPRRLAELFREEACSLQHHNRQ